MNPLHVCSATQRWALILSKNSSAKNEIKKLILYLFVLLHKGGHQGLSNNTRRSARGLTNPINARSGHQPSQNFHRLSGKTNKSSPRLFCKWALRPPKCFTARGERNTCFFGCNAQRWALRSLLYYKTVRRRSKCLSLH